MNEIKPCPEHNFEKHVIRVMMDGINRETGEPNYMWVCSKDSNGWGEPFCRSEKGDFLNHYWRTATLKEPKFFRKGIYDTNCSRCGFHFVTGSHNILI